MCGLAGLMLLPYKRTKDELQKIRHYFTLNLLYNMERGKEATGICIIQKDGKFEIFKLPLPADKFINLKEYRELISTVSNQTLFVLGHTRKHTKGKPMNISNDHPILAGNVIGIHNGEITNDEKITLSEQLERNAVVDSEVIFRLLDKKGPFNGNQNDILNIKYITSQLKGSFSTLSVDVRKPDVLLILKKNMPLSVHFESLLHAVFFSSRYIFLRKTFGRYVVTEALSSETGFFFSPSKFKEESPYAYKIFKF